MIIYQIFSQPLLSIFVKQCGKMHYFYNIVLEPVVAVFTRMQSAHILGVIGILHFVLKLVEKVACYTVNYLGFIGCQRHAARFTIHAERIVGSQECAGPIL